MKKARTRPFSVKSQAFGALTSVDVFGSFRPVMRKSGWENTAVRKNRIYVVISWSDLKARKYIIHHTDSYCMHIHSHFMSSSPLQALLFFLVAMWLSIFQLHSEKTVMLHQSESNLPHCTLKSLKFTQLFIRPKLEISGQGTTSKGLVTWGDQSGSCQIGLKKKNRKIMGKNTWWWLTNKSYPSKERNTQIVECSSKNHALPTLRQGTLHITFVLRLQVITPCWCSLQLPFHQWLHQSISQIFCLP